MRRTILAALAVTLLPVFATAQQRPAAAKTAEASQLVYFGTRAGGPGNGIVAARFDPRTGALQPLGLQAAVERPTWLLPSPHRSVLYAVSEVGNDGKSEASVLSFAADPATAALTQISKVPSGGGGATHLFLGGMPPVILVANFGSGHVATIPVAPGGVLSAPSSVRQDTGSGPHPRQKSAHPHGVAVAPGGKFALVADLGADRVFVYPFNKATSTLGENPTSVAVKAGSGPRHIAFRRDGRFIYVTSELTGEINIYAWNGDTGVLTPVRTLSPLPAGWTGERSAGELMISRDGRFLYISNRGEDVVVAYAIDAKTGALTEVQRIASGGKQPWNFATDATDRWLLVANEASDLVSVFRRDPATGKLAATGQTMTLPHPSSVAFIDERGR